MSLLDASREEIRAFRDVVSDSFEDDDVLSVEISVSSEERVVSIQRQRRAHQLKKKIEVYTGFVELLSEV